MELNPRQLKAAMSAIKAKATNNSTNVKPPDKQPGPGRLRDRKRLGKR
jgi:hypothetical protein